jgi:hypothetical protein
VLTTLQQINLIFFTLKFVILQSPPPTKIKHKFRRLAISAGRQKREAPHTAASPCQAVRRQEQPGYSYCTPTASSKTFLSSHKNFTLFSPAAAPFSESAYTLTLPSNSRVNMRQKTAVAREQLCVHVVFPETTQHAIMEETFSVRCM